MANSKYFRLEEAFSLGPFNFCNIGFRAIVQNEVLPLRIPFIVQVEEIILIEVNGEPLIGEEIEDFLAVQPPRLTNDLFWICHEFVFNTY